MVADIIYAEFPAVMTANNININSFCTIAYVFIFYEAMAYFYVGVIMVYYVVIHIESFNF